MIAALLIAVVLGVLTTYSLVGTPARMDGLAGGYFLGFGVLAVSGAGLAGVTLPWALGMTVALAVGLLLAPYLLAKPWSPFAAAVSMTVGLVMAAGILRWLVPIAASLTGLHAWVLAVAVIGAGAVWTVGGRTTWLRTAFGMALVAAVVLLIAGVVAGAPSTLSSPLVTPDISPVAGLGWLILLVLFAAAHPCPPRSPVAVAAVAGSLLLGLLGLLSLLGGSLVFPSTGLFTVVGYASIGSGVIGAVLGTVIIVVATVGVGVTMRGVLTPWQGFENPFRRLGGPGRRITVVAVLVGLLTFAPVPTALLVGLAAAFGVAAAALDMRAGRGQRPLKPKVVYQPPA